MSDQKYYQDFYSKTDWKQNNLLIKFGTKAYINILSSVLKKKPNSFCDVGCGSGRFTNAISKLGYSSKGLDFSSVAIEKARISFPHLDFICQDATDLRYTEKSDIFFVNGFSLFNTLDSQLVQKTIAYWSQFLNDEGAILIISKTDFSGNLINGWYYHTKVQVDEMFTMQEFSTQCFYIHSSLKYFCLLPFIKFWIKTSEFLSLFLYNKILKQPLRSIIIITKNV